MTEPSPGPSRDAGTSAKAPPTRTPAMVSSLRAPWLQLSSAPTRQGVPVARREAVPMPPLKSKAIIPRPPPTPPSATGPPAAAARAAATSAAPARYRRASLSQPSKHSATQGIAQSCPAASRSLRAISQSRAAS